VPHLTTSALFAALCLVVYLYEAGIYNCLYFCTSFEQINLSIAPIIVCMDTLIDVGSASLPT
jgi:hypothetical protein